MRERKFCATRHCAVGYDALVALLKLRLAPHETVHSLSTEFQALVQLNGENLAEYSRVLCRSAVSLPQVDAAFDVLDLSVVDIYWCVVFHHHLYP